MKGRTGTPMIGGARHPGTGMNTVELNAHRRVQAELATRRRRLTLELEQKIASGEVVPGRNKVRSQPSGSRSATQGPRESRHTADRTTASHEDRGANGATVISAGPGPEVVNQHEAIRR